METQQIQQKKPTRLPKPSRSQVLSPIFAVGSPMPRHDIVGLVGQTIRCLTVLFRIIRPTGQGHAIDLKRASTPFRGFGTHERSQAASVGGRADIG